MAYKISKTEDFKKNKTSFNKAVYRLKELAFSFGYDREPVKVKNISTKWNHFGVLDGDLARKVDTGLKDDYCILYSTEGPGEFPPHKHTVFESGIVLSGKITYETPDEKRELKEGDTYEIPAGCWHSFKFMEASALFIKFHPVFESGQWGATFK